MPFQIILLIFDSVPPNQWEKTCRKFLGGMILKETAMVRQTNLANGQSKNKCWMLSLRLQKLHFPSPLQFFRARLSFVRVTPLYKYHKNTLILSGTLMFQICFVNGNACLVKMALYMELTEKIPFWWRAHTKKSRLSLRFDFIALRTTWCQWRRLTPVCVLRKETLKV